VKARGYDEKLVLVQQSHEGKRAVAISRCPGPDEINELIDMRVGHGVSEPQVG
jgi:hypothetical protein